MSTSTSPQRRFEILREIASGGFGSVFLARLNQGDGFARMVAVKLLHPQWSDNEEVAKRMRDEARLLGLLQHRNIVDVLDLTRLDGRVAVVMEYVEAVDVKVILADLRARGERMPVAAVLQLIAQSASALDAAFNKPPFEGQHPLYAIHRDIKPSNLMVDSQGVVKVLDFGLARGEFEEREAETQGMQFGSFDYMPPERRFLESGGETSDVYSLGAVLYELLALEKIGKGKLKATMHAAWVGDRVATLRANLAGNPRVLDELCGFLESMLAFSAEARPRPQEVVNALRRMARAASDGVLEEWAERNVPPLVAVAREAQAQVPANPLVGLTLSEDRLPSLNDATPRPPVRSTPPPVNRWETPVPKRVRDAAPSRPALTGTMTPAPLRRRKTPTPPPPPEVQRASFTPPGARYMPGPATPQLPETPPPGPVSNALYVAVWLLGVLVLLLGLVAVGLAFVLRTAG